MNKGKRIPIEAAKRIAKEYGYDQVVILARLVGEDGKEQVATYGVNKDHCAVAGNMGQTLLELSAGKKKIVNTA